MNETIVVNGVISQNIGLERGSFKANITAPVLTSDVTITLPSSTGSLPLSSQVLLLSGGTMASGAAVNINSGTLSNIATATIGGTGITPLLQVKNTLNATLFEASPSGVTIGSNVILYFGDTDVSISRDLSDNMVLSDGFSTKTLSQIATSNSLNSVLGIGDTGTDKNFILNDVSSNRLFAAYTNGVDAGKIFIGSSSLSPQVIVTANSGRPISVTYTGADAGISVYSNAASSNCYYARIDGAIDSGVNIVSTVNAAFTGLKITLPSSASTSRGALIDVGSGDGLGGEGLVITNRANGKAALVASNIGDNGGPAGEFEGRDANTGYEALHVRRKSGAPGIILQCAEGDSIDSYIPYFSVTSLTGAISKFGRGLVVNDNPTALSPTPLGYFQVKGVSDDYLIRTDPDNDRIGIGAIPSGYKIDMGGDARLRGSSQLLFGGTGLADADVNLYRNDVDELKTDDAFTSGGEIKAENGINVSSGSVVFLDTDVAIFRDTDDLKFQDINTNSGNPVTLSQLYGGASSSERFGVQSVVASDYVDIVFATALSGTDYTAIVTPEGPVTCWVSAKTTGGMTIQISSTFTGNINWLAKE